MRVAVLLLLLPGCFDVPEPQPIDASYVRDASTPFDAWQRDAGMDTPRVDARIDGAVRDATTPIEAGAADASVHDATIDASIPTTILITELRTRGPAGANDELVEITNVGVLPASIGGFRLRAVGATGSVGTRAIVPEGFVLASGKSYLFANGGSSGYSGTVMPNATYTIGLADECGVAIADASGNVLDALGTFAGAALLEGAPRAPLTENADRSHARRRGVGGTYLDTGDNAADFEPIMPSTPAASATAHP